MFKTDPGGQIKPGILLQKENSYVVLDIQSCISGFPDTLDEAIRNNQLPLLKELSSSSGELHPLDACQIFAPLTNPRKILCVGLNYRDHALEGGRTVPEFPTIFQKASTAIIGHQQPICLPLKSKRVDFEAELAVVIGKTMKHASQSEAMNGIAGYTILNDVSARDLSRRTSQWTLGKSCDTFAPIGPYLVTPDSIPDPGKLEIYSCLNGVEMQHSNTSNLIFSIPVLLEEISSVITLEPGDILSTGTPAGVGDFRTPPIYLAEGDVFDITIEGLGTLSNPVQKSS